MGTLTPWIEELIIGGVLIVFAWAFRSWSTRLGEGLKKLDSIENVLLGKLDVLSKEFHEHTLRTEARVTRVETKVDILVENGRRRHEDQPR